MTSRERALAFFTSAVDAVMPHRLMVASFSQWSDVLNARRILVVGGGKAGAGMAESLEVLLKDHLDKVEGLINVPEGATGKLKRIRLNFARPAGVNFPTAAGVAGSEEMLRLMASAGPDDAAICLISGGGSALLPAPVEGVSLDAKLAVTKLLHSCGATIDEMNCVRKHLSRIKGGRLAQAFRGRLLVSLIISDVIGDPLDVIASGPTSVDPTTFQDALEILEKFKLVEKCPSEVVGYLKSNTQLRASGFIPEARNEKSPALHEETLKSPLPNVRNLIVGNNAMALSVVENQAQHSGYNVINLGSFIQGETTEVAKVMAGIVRSIHTQGTPVSAPACILFGGETTVTLGPKPGKGGRNQEFVLAMLKELGREGMRDVTVLSGGTDGEDGPTDAAGAIADEFTFDRLGGLSIEDSLSRHNAYGVFDRTGDLIRVGLTNTNVMDVRMIFVESRDFDGPE